ncbi:uroporphyrinogen-III C-methyltransferase [Acidithiobacillus sulfuriphilus]|uniref:uroporphyrinogen-III C-methyltransferase n=2 Tax=Acidithiobacillus sulfuriphilus TaxID=1867749 RepID=A0A3M8QXM1_9PROT|nr:uroporphyrinogen-III C-methyltransferase [Acidithiobacillus sulfuriphilus]RNF61039.1 uroporphyrinogen-III C-methyltransferase [Acidithiobacillus sulfuriphilus]
MNCPSKVYLIGAGPGDPELLTLKAARLLQTADILFHDALANPRILDLARPDAQRVDVGKRGGRISTPQLSIQAQMIHAAQRGLQVVRLKGGDPFIFGRGGEECMALRAAGIAYEIVPGITSGMAAAAYAGVPLTYRAVSQSVLLVTGHEAPGAAPVDWRRMAGVADTLVIYMGVERVEKIRDGLLAGGLSPSTPALAVEWATLQQHEVHSTLADLPAQIARNGLKSPAILVIGAVVEMSACLSWRPSGSGALPQAACL